MPIRFEFLSSYRGDSDFMVHESGKPSYRVGLRRSAPEEEERRTYSEIGFIEAQSGVGILRRSVADNAGEVPQYVVDAFNAMRAAEHATALAKYGVDVLSRYGHDKAPEPAKAGRWASGEGWHAIAPDREIA